MKWKIESWVTDPSEIKKLNDEICNLMIVQKVTPDEDKKIWDAKTMGFVRFSPREQVSILVSTITQTVKTLGDLTYQKGHEIPVRTILSLNQKQAVLSMGSMGDLLIDPIDIVLSSREFETGFLLRTCYMGAFNVRGALADFVEPIPFQCIARVTRVQEAIKEEKKVYVVALASDQGHSHVLGVFHKREDAQTCMDNHISTLIKVPTLRKVTRNKDNYKYSLQAYHDLVTEYELKVQESTLQ